MKMSLSGFSLLELMIALALTSLVSLLAAHFVASSHVRLNHNARRATRFMALTSAQELLRRDIKQAPAAYDEWKLISGTEYVWHAHEEDIGWQIEHDDLYRSKGLYDVKRRVWIERAKSRVAGGIRQLVMRLEFSPEKHVAAVEVLLAADVDGEQHGFNVYERLRNGEII